jgi:WD40 repeat protein
VSCFSKRFIKGLFILLTTEAYTNAEVESIHSLLQTEFIPTFNSDLDSLNHISEYFSQSFYQERSQTPWNKFLKLHTGSIYCVGVSNDKKTIVSGGDDLSLKLWDLASKSVRFVLEGHTNVVYALEIAKNDKILVSGSFDRTVRLWSIEELKQICVFKRHKAQVLTVAISEDCQFVASGSADNTVFVWSVKEERLKYKLTAHKDNVVLVRFWRDSLVSGSNDGKIISWNSETGKINSILVQDSDKINCFDFAKYSTQIVTGSSNGVLRIWKNKLILSTLKSGSSISAVRFANGDKRLISTASDSIVSIWSLKHNSQLSYFQIHNACATCLFPLSDSEFITGSLDCSLVCFSTLSLSLLSVLTLHALDLIECSIAKNLVICPSGDMIRLWNLESNSVEAELSGHIGLVCCVSWDNSLLVSGGRDCSVRIWSLIHKAQTTLFQGHAQPVLTVSIEGDVVVSGSADGTVRVWSVRQKTASGVLRGHNGPVRSVAISKDCNSIVSGGEDCSVRVWSVRKMQLKFVLSGHRTRIFMVRVTRDNKYVVSGAVGDGVVKVWKIRNGEICNNLASLEQAEEWLSEYPEVKILIDRVL